MKIVAALRIPQELYFGEGSAETIGNYAKNLGAGKVFLVSDTGVKSVGVVDQLKIWLQNSGLDVEVYLDIEPEPSLHTVEKCLSAVRQYIPNVVIGLGGGSVLDIAKTVAMLVTNDGPVEDFLGRGLVKRRGIPTILIPTTSGTGAEITPNALFYLPKLRTKEAIVSEHIVPNIAIVDPLFTISVPPKLSAATGMDALCHAIESYTALNSTPLTRLFAKESISLIAQNLRQAVFNGEDRKARHEMALGSLFAAISMANSGTNAVHALAYPLQGLHRIPHGVANAMLLPYVMDYNLLGNLQSFAEIAMFMGQPTSHLSQREAAAMSAFACRQLSEDIGIPQKMSEFGISVNDLDDLVDGAIKIQRLLTNNPRAIDAEVVRNIFQGAL